MGPEYLLPTTRPMADHSSDDEFGAAPMELSSKKRVGRAKTVVAPKRIKPKSVDPRFDERFGAMKASFAKSYDFIDDIKQEELKKLQKDAKSSQLTEEARDNVLRAKSILEDQLRSKKNRMQFEQLRGEKRRQEAALVAKGRKPFFAKKSDLKQELKERKFEELKKKGQLEKWMAKKSKRKASKQRKLLPARRIRHSDE